VRGGTSYEDAIADLKGFGAPEDVIAQLEEIQQGEDFDVFPENWETMEVFLRLQTQWRVSQGAFIGLDYNAAKFIFDVCKIEDQKETLDGLQIIEFAALKALNERAK